MLIQLLVKLATVKIIYLLQFGERAGAGGVEGGGGGAGGPARARQTAQVPYHPQISAAKRLRYPIIHK